MGQGGLWKAESDATLYACPCMGAEQNTPNVLFTWACPHVLLRPGTEHEARAGHLWVGSSHFRFREAVGAWGMALLSIMYCLEHSRQNFP